RALVVPELLENIALWDVSIAIAADPAFWADLQELVEFPDRFAKFPLILEDEASVEMGFGEAGIEFERPAVFDKGPLLVLPGLVALTPPVVALGIQGPKPQRPIDRLERF